MWILTTITVSITYFKVLITIATTLSPNNPIIDYFFDNLLNPSSNNHTLNNITGINDNNKDLNNHGYWWVIIILSSNKLLFNYLYGNKW